MSNKLKPELLCPVGGKLQLIAAVENGADAVYLGGAEFNARIYADNFTSIENIEEAVDYAHLRNVKVYVTLNTLVNDSEFEKAVDYAAKLYNIGVDAVIVQDLGLVHKISNQLPDLKIHISTQGTIYSKDGVKYFNKYNNIERIVLARELNLNEIEEIIKNTDKEIEVFIHGALCVCYSGQCKLSSQIGARSGNRGKCAQPCRLPYKLIDSMGNNVLDENYYLSTKDICTIDILPKLIQAGIHSFKIEGRMKSPEYVAAVTRIYRKYIDMCFNNKEYIVEKEDKDILLQVFNRGNFSQGYLLNKDSKKIWCNTKPKHLGTYLGKVIEYDKKKNNIDIKLEQDIAIGDVIEVSNKELSSAMISFIRSKKDRVKIARSGDIVTIGDIKGNISKGQEVYKIISKLLNEELRLSFNEKIYRKNNLDIKVILDIDKQPVIEVSTNIFGKEFKVEVTDGQKCEKGINKVLTEEDVVKQIIKTGDVPFKANNVRVEIENGVMTPISNLNQVRRKAIETLSQKIIESFKHDKINITETEYKEDKYIRDNNINTKISMYIYDINSIKNIEVLNKADRIYISLEDLINRKEEILASIDNKKIYVYLPTITTEKYKEFLKDNIDTIKEIRNILITNIEHIEMFKDMDLNICLDNSFNIFNSESLKSISANNVECVNLSNELSLDQINNIKKENNTQIEVDVYGNEQVMYSNFCILNATNNCLKCKENKYSLKDRKEMMFPVRFNRVQCNMQILNSSKLFSEEAIKSLNNKVDYMRLYIYDENNERINEVIDTVKQLLKLKDNAIKFKTTDKEKYTNGHFFREV